MGREGHYRCLAIYSWTRRHRSEKTCVFSRNPSTLNQAISFAEEFVSFNVQCLDVSREETVDDVPVEREVGDFDDQQSDLAEIVESLTEIERQVLALSERTGFVARSSAQCRGLSRKPHEFRLFVRYPSSTLSNCSSKRGKGKDTDVVLEKTEKCQKGVLGESVFRVHLLYQLVGKYLLLPKIVCRIPWS